jgi:hypothetical protein
MQQCSNATRKQQIHKQFKFLSGTIGLYGAYIHPMTLYTFQQANIYHVLREEGAWRIMYPIRSEGARGTIVLWSYQQPYIKLNEDTFLSTSLFSFGPFSLIAPVKKVKRAMTQKRSALDAGRTEHHDFSRRNGQGLWRGPTTPYHGNSIASCFSECFQLSWARTIVD